jgi:hypothetical protein
VPSARGFLLSAAGVLVAPVNLDAGLTRAQAAMLLRVSPHTVSMWALDGWLDTDGRRRWLTVVGRGRAGRLFRYGDLVDAEADTRHNPNSRRGRRRTSAA